MAVSVASGAITGTFVGTSNSGVAEGTTLVGVGWPEDPKLQAIVDNKRIRIG